MSKRSPNAQNPSPSKQLADASTNPNSAKNEEKEPQKSLPAISNRSTEVEGSREGLYMLVGLLRKALAVEIGTLICDVGLNYRYDDDKENHHFNFTIDRHLKGQRYMSAAVRKDVRFEIREGIHRFLQDLDVFMDAGQGKISSREGKICFTRKIDLFQQLKSYFEEVCHQDVEIKTHRFADKDEDGDKLPKDIARSQSHPEEMSHIFETITSLIPRYPDLTHKLFGHMPVQPFSSLTEAYAFAATISQKEGDPDHLPTILAMAEQVIRHEDKLEDSREDHMQLLHDPIKFSIN